MMLIWVFVIGIVIYFLMDKGTFSFDRRSNPMNLLDERLARGEVTLEDYKKLKNEMRGL